MYEMFMGALDQAIPWSTGRARAAAASSTASGACRTPDGRGRRAPRDGGPAGQPLMIKKLGQQGHVTERST